MRHTRGRSLFFRQLRWKDPDLVVILVCFLFFRTQKVERVETVRRREQDQAQFLNNTTNKRLPKPQKKGKKKTPPHPSFAEEEHIIEHGVDRGTGLVDRNNHRVALTTEVADGGHYLVTEHVVPGFYNFVS